MVAVSNPPRVLISSGQLNRPDSQDSGRAEIRNSLWVLEPGSSSHKRFPAATSLISARPHPLDPASAPPATGDRRCDLRIDLPKRLSPGLPRYWRPRTSDT